MTVVESPFTASVRIRRRLAVAAFVLCGLTAARADGQAAPPARDSASAAAAAAAGPRDSLAAGPRRLWQRRTAHFAHETHLVAEAGARVVILADSEGDAWSRRGDGASAFFRRTAPVAFWVPVAAVVAEPLVWADERRDGHAANAAYARSATTALALGFVVSRATKFVVHRERPCTGEGPGAVSFRPAAADAAGCPRGSHVSGSSSFFSEHAMAAFAIASSSSFLAQRRNASNVPLITGAAFSVATLLGASRVYQHHHWLSDVLVGAAVGTASGYVGAQLTPVPRGRVPRAR